MPKIAWKVQFTKKNVLNQARNERRRKDLIFYKTGKTIL